VIHESRLGKTNHCHCGKVTMMMIDWLASMINVFELDAILQWHTGAKGVENHSKILAGSAVTSRTAGAWIKWSAIWVWDKNIAWRTIVGNSYHRTSLRSRACIIWIVVGTMNITMTYIALQIRNRSKSFDRLLIAPSRTRANWRNHKCSFWYYKQNTDQKVLKIGSKINSNVENGRRFH